MSSGMALLLGAIALFIFVALIVAAVIAVHESDASRPLQSHAAGGVGNVAGKLGAVVDSNLDPDEVTVRTSGLVEFLHELPAIANAGRRTGVAAMALALAAALAILGVAAIVAERVEDRREVEACYDAVAAVLTPTTTAETTTTTTMTATAAPTNPAGGGGEAPSGGSQPGTETPPEQAASGDASDAPPEENGNQTNGTEPTATTSPADLATAVTACQNDDDDDEGDDDGSEGEGEGEGDGSPAESPGANDRNPENAGNP
jgi:hypothetical protein